MRVLFLATRLTVAYRSNGLHLGTKGLKARVPEVFENCRPVLPEAGFAAMGPILRLEISHFNPRLRLIA